jgi:hypothetical protein
MHCDCAIANPYKWAIKPSPQCVYVFGGRILNQVHMIICEFDTEIVHLGRTVSIGSIEYIMDI